MQQENRLARALECAKCGQASIKVRCSPPAEVSKLLRPFSFVVEGRGGGGVVDPQYGACIDFYVQSLKLPWPICLLGAIAHFGVTGDLEDKSCFGVV